MESKIFVDSGGFFACMSPDDEWHEKATRMLRDVQAGGATLLTTDYVLDETLTLLKARGSYHRVPEFLRRINNSSHCHIEWIGAARFAAAQEMFLKYSDKQWSFTDCTSFTLMEEMGIRQAMAADMHFEQAGFELLLVD